MAVRVPYPFAVFAPGNKHDEIIGMIQSAASFVDQFILFVCPSAIGHLLLRARQTGRPLPLAKLRYIVIGEPFPESLRTTLQWEAGLSDLESPLFSIYGSADTNVLGFESPVSVALRKLCSQNAALQKSLGFQEGTPLFFHLADPQAYLETVKGELCVTKWQGIPLLRYNLHDRVELLRWQECRRAVSGSAALRPEDEQLARLVAAGDEELPDLIAVMGRADRCLILCGTNLTEFMLDEAVRCSELQELLTGLYRAAVVFEGGRQSLELIVEFRDGVAVNRDALNRTYHGLVAALGRVQTEFREDWQNIYRQWDDDPSQRILRLRGVSWPELSRQTETGIKQRGI